jgi:hypothetical protein
LEIDFSFCKKKREKKRKERKRKEKEKKNKRIRKKKENKRGQKTEWKQKPLAIIVTWSYLSSMTKSF